MYRTFLSIAAVSTLVACGGGDGANPITGGAIVDDTIDPDDPNTVASRIFAFDVAEGLVMNSLEYDEDTDQLIINNIPFDTTTGRYDNTTAGAFLANGSGWALYENDERGQEGRQQFFSVFKQSSTGNAFASTVTTGDFIEAGNGGATAQRVAGGTPALPSTGIVFYTGDYAGIQNVFNGAGADDIRLVSGDANVSIDFDDFDVTGDIVGTISNRQVYDNAGNLLGSIGPVSLAEAAIIRGNGTIGESTSRTIDDSDGAELTGTWEGVFAGPNGEEIAAIIVLRGTIDDDFDATTEAVDGTEYGAIIVEATE